MDNEATKFIPLDADIRNYATKFICTNCSYKIVLSMPRKEIEFNYCPYCGKRVTQKLIITKELLNQPFFDARKYFEGETHDNQ